MISLAHQNDPGDCHLQTRQDQLKRSSLCNVTLLLSFINYKSRTEKSSVEMSAMNRTRVTVTLKKRAKWNFSFCSSNSSGHKERNCWDAILPVHGLCRWLKNTVSGSAGKQDKHLKTPELQCYRCQKMSPVFSHSWRGGENQTNRKKKFCGRWEISALPLPPPPTNNIERALAPPLRPLCRRSGRCHVLTLHIPTSLPWRDVMKEQCSAGVAARIRVTTWKTSAGSRRADAPRVAVRIPKSLSSFFHSIQDSRWRARERASRCSGSKVASAARSPHLCCCHSPSKLQNCQIKINVKKKKENAEESFMWEQLLWTPRGIVLAPLTFLSLKFD